jgi:CubicO group peptidase (beta-lactamase class C family)
MNAQTLIPGDPEAAGLCSAQLDRASAYVQRAVEEGILPLADILIARHGKIACHRSFIHPKLVEEGYHLNPDSLFYLASFTKIFVATLIMQQVERGSISLERPVAEYIPEFGQRGKKQVTVRHLLCHASGLPDDLPGPIIQIGPVEELIELICQQRLIFSSGTRSSYCTWGFVLLAEILRRVAGEELEPLGRKNLFDLLGMADTHFGYEESWKERVIPIFDSKMELHEWHTPEVLGCLRGDTGAYSTALDIAAVCQMMLNLGSYGDARILSPVTVQRIIERQYPWWDTPERLSAGPEEQFLTLSKGLGWMVRGDNFFRGSELMSPRAFFHGGHMGMRAIVDPEYDLITVFMTSIVATDPDVSAYFGHPGQIHHTFGTMAFAAVAER